METAIINASSVTGLVWGSGGTALTTKTDTTVLNNSGGTVYYWTTNPSEKDRLQSPQTFLQTPVTVQFNFANDDGAQAPQVTLTVTGRPPDV